MFDRVSIQADVKLVHHNKGVKAMHVFISTSEDVNILLQEGNYFDFLLLGQVITDKDRPGAF